MSQGINLFLVGVALGVIEFHGAQDYRFRYEPRTPTDPRFVRFTNNLDEAASQLRKTGLDQKVSLGVREFRELHGPREVVDKLVDFIKKSNRKFVNSSGEQLSEREIEDRLLNYIFKDKALIEAYRQKYPDEWLDKMLRPDEENKMAYFCPHCEQKLGYTPESLYVRDGEGSTSKRERKCAYCKKNLDRPPDV